MIETFNIIMFYIGCAVFGVSVLLILDRVIKIIVKLITKK